MQTKTRFTSESGNALWFIMIAIVLLATLTVFLTRSNREAASNADPEQYSILASRIIGYASDIEQSVTRMRSQGVSENDLCFDSESWGHTDYNFAACATRSNRIFDTEGGAISWQDLPPQVRDTNGGATWVFIGQNEVVGVGTDCAASGCDELLAVAHGLNREICIQINKLSGITNTGGNPPDDGDFATGPAAQYYKGVFTYAAKIGDTATEVQGKKSGCVYESTNVPPRYSYYHVLIER